MIRSPDKLDVTGLTACVMKMFLIDQTLDQLTSTTRTGIVQLRVAARHNRRPKSDYTVLFTDKHCGKKAPLRGGV